MRILWIPHTGWHIPQRAHLFCRALAERHEVHVTDWAADFTSVRDYLSRRYVRNFVYRQYRDDSITVHGIPRFSPALFVPILRRLNSAIYARFVRHIIAKYKIDAVVGTFVVPPPSAPWLVFDLFDDNPSYWRLYGHRPDYAAEIEQVEHAYLQKADRVVTVSSVLRDYAVSQRRLLRSENVHLIPNGVNIARYQTGDGNRIRKQLGLTDFTIIGLISALGEFTGVLRLIEAFSQLTIPQIALLIVGDGPYLQPARQRARELGLMNVIFTGRVSFDQVAHYYKALDIGVVPFDRSPFTDAACPIKLLEYTAAGKMVVCTDLVEPRQMNFPNVQFVADTPSALAAGIRRVLNVRVQLPANLSDYDIRNLIIRYETVLAGS